MGAAAPFLLFRSVPFIAVLAAGLGGCESMGLGEPSVPSVSSVTSMFDKKQEPLPGRRISVLKADEKGTVSGPEATGPIVLPPAMANASWSQPGGVASNAPGHLAIGDALHTLWTADAGEGSSKRQRLTAIPIVYGNKIYTMDFGRHHPRHLRQRRFQALVGQDGAGPEVRVRFCTPVQLQ